MDTIAIQMTTVETVLHCQINNSVVSYDWTSIEQAVASVRPCSFPMLFAQTPYTLNIGPNVKQHWIEKKALQRFLNWMLENATQTEERKILQAVQKALVVKRNKSRKHRWEIAYRQKYKCSMCQDLLHPKAMDIDHIQEIQDGGLDNLDNLQALCSNCHAKKSRSRKSKYF